MKNVLRGVFLCLFAWSLLAPAGAQGAQAAQAQKPVVIDRIVAIVNNEVITQVELDDRLKLAVRQLKQQGTPLPPMNVIRRQLLEQLITDRVQLEYAKQIGLHVDDTELDRAIERVAEQNKLTVPQLKEALAREGVPFDKFRNDLHTEIVLAQLRQREVDDKIVVPESEIDSFLAMQKARKGASEEYNISHILILVPENATPAQIEERRQRAEKVLAQLKAGADFRQVAAAYSDAPDALKGGELGWQDGERLPTLFYDAVKNMHAGEISGILRSSNGFHILRLNAKRSGAPPLMVEQTHVRHILIKTSEVVSDAEARRRLLELRERIEHGASFAQLAREYSQDASASNGGDLGWVSPGDTVPAFEHAMNALKVGQISEPVRTQFGWHLIQVLGRRTVDMSKERSRLMARNILRARKSDEAYQDWIRRLRDRAYIELLLHEQPDSASG